MRRFGREPGREELTGHIENFVDRELLFRSALELGLDRDDPIVRRRLIQKMRYLLNIEPAQISVSEEEILAYFEAHRERYIRRERVGFQQVFIGETLPEGFNLRDPADLPKDFGLDPGTTNFVKSFPLDRVFIEVSVSKVANDFGEGFSKALTGLEPGQWSGPLRSRYGSHFVWLEEYQPDSFAVLDDVRGLVIRDFKTQKVQQAERAEMNRLRSNFSVVIETAAESDGLKSRSP